VSSQLGVSDEKIDALSNYASSSLYTENERLVLEFADCMTITGRDVSDELFAKLREVFDEDSLVELTATIAWENASSKFNRALRVPSQQLWKRRQ
jgi:alkylhydroperoxidase family enzyme